MRLLVLTAAYPAPSEPQRAVFIENLTRLQVRMPGEVVVVAPRVCPSDPRAELRADVPVRRFSYPGRGRRLKEISRPSRALLGAYAVSGVRCALKQLRSLRPDCILCHWLLPTGPLAAFAATRHRIPLVVMVHGSDLNVYARSGFGRRLARLVLRRAARVLAVSEPLVEILVRDFDVPAARVQCLPMGVDDSLFTPPASGEESVERRAAREELGLDPEKTTFLFVGDLIDAKGVRELLAAWRGVARRGVATQLCLVGDGPARDGAAAAAGVRFAGRVTPHELVRWYRAADVFVLPSHGEGTPVSLMEALSCGVPAVASQVGGVPDVIRRGGAGRLVPPGDVGALTTALVDLAESPEKLERLRERLRELPADRFSLDRCARELRGVLQEVAGGA